MSHHKASSCVAMKSVRKVLVAMFWNTFIYKCGFQGITFATGWQSECLVCPSVEADAHLTNVLLEQQVFKNR